jgi:hypothetical protein
MGLLVPAFLAGVLAIGIPIWVHLTNKQRKEAVEFPSLMFLEKIPFRSEKKQVIRNVLLFAMRVLALILLVMAFSRPFLGKITRPPAGLGAAREVAILVDRSYSMGYADRWERALDAARDAVDGMGGADQGTIILFDERATALGEPTSDKAALKAMLATAKLGDKATRYPAALKLAQKILEESELPRLEVILISDFQKVAWDGHEEVQLPEGTVVKPVDLSADSTANLAVTNVSLKRETLEGRDRFTASARITNSSARDEKALAVNLSINGRVVEAKRVDVPGNNAVNATFASVAVPEGTTRGTVSITDAGLATDNDFHFIISADQEVGVIIIEDESPLPNQSFFLRQTLAIGDNPRFRVDVRSASRTGFGDLDRRALIILNDAPFPGGDLGKRIKDFVNEGGGLFIVLGDQSNAQGWVGDGALLLPGKAGNVVRRNPGNGAALATIDRGHPIFEVFNAPRSGDFSVARFFTYRPIAPADSAKVLARFDDGSAAMVEGSYGQGRVVVFAAALDGADAHTDLPRHAVFLPAVHEVAKHVASFADTRPWFNVGDVVDVVLQADPTGTGAASRSGTDARASLADIALIAPSGDQAGTDSAARPGFVELEEKGFYELRKAGERANSIPLAVNVDLAESDLSRFEPVDLVTSVQHRVSDGSGGASGRNLTAEQKERRQNLWWYLLALALILLAAETMLGNRLSPALRGRTS